MKVHGTDLGIASSPDGQNWKYRGIIDGLNIENGRNTFWAPEILFHHGLYHMFVSYIQGVPSDWPGRERQILHYTSENLWEWTFHSKLQLSSNYVIDAAVERLPIGIWRMWYKDEENGSHTYAADSEDLFHWEVVGPVITGFPHEGVNVFQWHGTYWMIIDQWNGQGVYHSIDGENWNYNGMILDQSGKREDDQGYGYHADVLIQDEKVYIFYFTHPGRNQETDESTYESKRSSIQVAELAIRDGTLHCERNSPFVFLLKGRGGSV